MLNVNVDRASALDKIHTKRMFHAYGQVLLRVLALEDPEVNQILWDYGVTILPGPAAAIDYAVYAKQVLANELKAENAKAAILAPKLKAKSKAKK